MDVRKHNTINYISWCLGIGLGYFLVGVLVLSISLTNVGLIWPSAGLALSALLIKGWRLWPGVFLGSLLSNVANDVSFFCAFSISVGSSLSALAGWYLLVRWRNFSMKLDSTKNITCFIFYGSIFPTIISAIIGNISLLGFGLITSDDLLASFLNWWLGDAMGVVILGSLILLVAEPETEKSQ